MSPSIQVGPSARSRIESTMEVIHGYSPDEYWTYACIGCCFMIGIVLRIGACLALVYTNRDKQAQV